MRRISVGEVIDAVRQTGVKVVKGEWYEEQVFMDGRTPITCACPLMAVVIRETGHPIIEESFVEVEDAVDRALHLNPAYRHGFTVGVDTVDTRDAWVMPPYEEGTPEREMWDLGRLDGQTVWSAVVKEGMEYLPPDENDDDRYQ